MNSQTPKWLGAVAAALCVGWLIGYLMNGSPSSKAAQRPAAATVANSIESSRSASPVSFLSENRGEESSPATGEETQRVEESLANVLRILNPTRRTHDLYAIVSQSSRVGCH
jgi:hypothetical protein